MILHQLDESRARQTRASSFKTRAYANKIQLRFWGVTDAGDQNSVH